MDPENYRNDSLENPDSTRARQPYRRQVRHISQEPINDLDSDYVTVDRLHSGSSAPYQPSRRNAHSGRRHMGVASPDSEYLQDPSAAGEAHNYARFLQTPKPGKSIFTARRERRRRIRLIAAALAIVAVVAAVVVIVLLL